MDKSEIIDYLKEFASERRWELFNKIINQRTRYLTLVLEDIYQSHNASAVLRTCDCFGIQDVHIIENRNEYDVNPDVSLGSDKWLTLKKYNSEQNNTANTIKELKSQGYRIVATTPHKDDIDLEEFNIERGKVAFMFGTELRGLSDEALQHADEHLKIPMYGFSESFNISVSAAIIFHHLTHKLRNTKNLDWQLNTEERKEILLDWLKASVKDSNRIIDRYLQKKKINY